MIKIGERFGHFLIKAEIGRGGMGTIFHAIDTMLNREVALKIIHPQFADNAQLMERFKIEAMTQARMNHPNIVTIYSFNRIDSDYVIVMEYVNGHSIKELLKEKKRLHIPAAIGYARQTLDGLKYSHAHHVIHRDIKPANILINSENNVKISDFGIAKVFGTEGLTKTGILVGTPWYTSPEQIMGREIDFRADLYSLGVTLYEMLTGRVPFDSPGNSEFQIQRAHLEEAPPRPSQFNPDITADVERFLLKSLQKKQEKRFQSVDEMQQMLNSLLLFKEEEKATTPIGRRRPAEPVKTGKRFFTPLRIVGFSIFVLSALLIAGFVFGLFKFPKFRQASSLKTFAQTQTPKTETPLQKTENPEADRQTPSLNIQPSRDIIGGDIRGKPVEGPVPSQNNPSINTAKPRQDTSADASRIEGQGEKADTKKPPPASDAKPEKREPAKGDNAGNKDSQANKVRDVSPGLDATLLSVQSMISRNQLEAAEKEIEKNIQTQPFPRVLRMAGLVKFLLDKYDEAEDLWKRVIAAGDWIELQVLHLHEDNTECSGLLKMKRGLMIFNSQTRADHSFWLRATDLVALETRKSMGMAFLQDVNDRKKDVVLRLRENRERDRKETFLVEFIRKNIL